VASRGAARCTVADDHPAVVAAVAALLDRQPAIELVGEATDGLEALRQIEELEPEIAILDSQMPGRSGLEVAHDLALRSSRTAVILYTGFPDPETLETALEAGVRGFVLKGAPLRDLLRAIEAVLAGDSFVDPSLAGRVAVPERGPEVATLNAREREILGLVAGGARASAIAAQYALPLHTVRAHVDSAVAKLAAVNRTHAVALALRRSLIP